MDQVLPAASWLMALAAVVSAAACLAAWRDVPWQGRQSALVMAGAMVALAVVEPGAVAALVLGLVLLLSAMLGTVGVRGTPAAAACCHRALASLVMAICAFEGATSSGTTAGDSTASGAGSSAMSSVVSAGHGSHGFSGVLSVLAIIGVVTVVLWTIVSEWDLAPAHRRRAARVLRVESWAMAAGVGVMCLGW
ncbi:hypothetical protein [Microbacterium sp.]|uniref:hypothetical protein n=1 Tax=Microbacterium sp. TaxID=51671 RepID=UPI003566BE36